MRGIAVAIVLMLGASQANAQPADQRAFAAANEAAQPADGRESALHGIERKLEARDKAVCKAKPSPDIRDWVGTVSSLDQSNGGYAITIDIGRKVTVHEFIDPSELPRQTAEQRKDAARQLAVVEMLKGLRRGDRVVFSGRFYTGYFGNCPVATNVLIVRRHDEPDYSVRFRTITRL